MINSRKSYPNIYRLLFVLADCEVIYGNHFLRAKLQMQLYDVCSNIHYFLQHFQWLYLNLMSSAPDGKPVRMNRSHNDFLSVRPLAQPKTFQ